MGTEDKVSAAKVSDISTRAGKRACEVSLISRHAVTSRDRTLLLKPNRGPSKKHAILPHIYAEAREFSMEFPFGISSFGMQRQL